ncbi:MAG TPA: carboxypeptidase-like regulatory domain-containing protein [Bryobacteraceae bacterium]|nr:carboxypeptidase-like regulatory domain-containing protein [Bryobacteraceae bacterium]
MARKQKTLIFVAIGLIGVAIIVAVRRGRSPANTILLTGAVLTEDPDPRRQTPVGNVKITAIGGAFSAETTSDSSGQFRLTVRPGLVPGRYITMRFEHAEYNALEVTEAANDRLYVVRMQPLARQPVAPPDHGSAPQTTAQIGNVRVRYSFKDQTTMNVGSIAKQFQAVNTGNVPCAGHRPCSSDGKWKAAIGSLTLDAGQGNVFRNARVSCIAGPCPFTRLGPDDLSRPVRVLQITALNWSDTASFLVEAEVTRTMATDMVRQSFPFITGQTMSFALPATAEGPSVVADLNDEQIVFPLGPNLILSWASCTVEVVPGGNRVYRCELKPGYQFQQ